MRVDKILARVWIPVALIVGVFAVCVTGFVLSEGTSVFNGVYWGVITIATIGYGDVVPTNNVAKVFAIILAVSTLGIIGYVISTIGSLAVQAREEELLGLDGTKFEGHVLLLGWTPVARAALRELLQTGRKVAIMTSDQPQLTEIRTFVAHLLGEARDDPELRAQLSTEKDVFIALGDFSQGAGLKLLNIPRASEAIVASDDDARNVMTALLLRHSGPHLRVVVAVTREELRETLHAAGVAYVISPSELGGRMVAAAALQPEIAQAFDDLTTTSYHYNVDQFPLVPPNPLLGRPFDAAARELREGTGATLIGIARPRPREEGKPPFEVLLSPPADLRLEVGCYALILSGGERLPQLLEW
ncbi:MAG: potassium channel family protein, partial [Thermoplasmata archaeon]